MRYVAILALAVIARPAVAQNAAAAWIQEAITYGTTKKVKPLVIVPIGTATTPFLRVALAASDAKKMMKNFGPGDVTEEMRRPEIVVRAHPAFGPKIRDTHRSVEHIVIQKKGSRSPEDAIQPTTTEIFESSVGNSFGAEVQRNGMVAAFPVEAMREGYQIAVIYPSAFLQPTTYTLTFDKKVLADARPNAQAGLRDELVSTASVGPPRRRDTGAAMPLILHEPLTIPPGMLFVADEQSKTYYPVSCQDARAIPVDRRLFYETESSVQGAGYTKWTAC